MEITYIDRKAKKKCIERVYGHKTLALLYGEGVFRGLFSKILLPLLAHFPLFSKVYGWLQKTSFSKKKIARFIREYEVDQSEFLESEFSSFNDFFIRKLKAQSRPIELDPNVFVMPADGRYLVYPQFDQFVVKGKEFSLKDFLKDSALAAHYSKGSMAIVRLCPSDYHRFHFPCDGKASSAHLINGPLYSVNPIALKKRLAILSENKRMITRIETPHFGTILYVEIGATFVGSIHQSYTPGPMQKGEEKGYFEFGGSCLVLLFEEGRITFDSDLIANTQKGMETRANFGESLGFTTISGP